MLSDTTFLLLIKLSLKSKFSIESRPTQVEKAKPNPEIFQLAFNKFGFGADDVAPEEVLVLEDSPLGVRAGQLFVYFQLFVHPRRAKRALVVEKMHVWRPTTS